MVAAAKRAGAGSTAPEARAGTGAEAVPGMLWDRRIVSRAPGWTSDGPDMADGSGRPNRAEADARRAIRAGEDGSAGVAGAMTVGEPIAGAAPAGAAVTVVAAAGWVALAPEAGWTDVVGIADSLDAKELAAVGAAVRRIACSGPDIG